jgi:release factor glutamine methyltransferase
MIARIQLERRHRIRDRSVSGSVWRLGPVLQEASGFLQSRQIENPRLNAERLLAHVLNLTRIDLYLQFDKPLTMEEREAYKTLLRRRAGHEPLQYILGGTEFMSLSFRVTPDVLIPRPETEILVEKVIERFRTVPSPTFLDIGTGSGCIAIGLAHSLPEAQITAVDVSEKALKIAFGNAEVNGVKGRIHFMPLDIRSPESPDILNEAFDAIVFNPPYVALTEWDRLAEEIRAHEPRIALCDEGDGLVFYRLIAEKAASWLKPEGFICLEAGDRKAAAIREIFEKNGFRTEGIHADLNGIERVIIFSKSTE